MSMAKATTGYFYYLCNPATSYSGIFRATCAVQPLRPTGKLMMNLKQLNILVHSHELILI
jgi:hypothetical protein